MVLSLNLVQRGLLELHINFEYLETHESSIQDQHFYKTALYPLGFDTFSFNQT